MIFTSASAGKMIKALEEKKRFLLEREEMTSTYVLAINEKADPPEYNYTETNATLKQLDKRVVKLRRALHLFNNNTVLPSAEITIDEALIVMAQLNRQARRLNKMRSMIPKQRVDQHSSRYVTSSSSTPEYKYANFDIAQAETDYQDTIKRIEELQLDLDLVNQTYTFEVDLPE